VIKEAKAASPTTLPKLEQVNKDYTSLPLKQKVEVMQQALPKDDSIEAVKRTRAELSRVQAQLEQSGTKRAVEEQRVVREVAKQSAERTDPDRFARINEKTKLPLPKTEEEINPLTPFDSSSSEAARAANSSTAEIEAIQAAEEEAKNITRELEHQLYVESMQEAEREAAKERAIRHVAEESVREEYSKVGKKFEDSKKEEVVTEYISKNKTQIEEALNELPAEDMDVLVEQFPVELTQDQKYQVGKDSRYGEAQYGIAPEPPKKLFEDIDVEKANFPPEVQANIKWIKTNSDKLDNEGVQKAMLRKFDKAIEGLAENSPEQDLIQSQLNLFYDLKNGKDKSEWKGLRNEADIVETFEQIVDSIERSGDTVQFDYNRKVSDASSLIAHVKSQDNGDGRLKALAQDLEVRLKTNVSEHNGYLALDSIGFNQRSLQQLDELSKSTPTGSLLNEMNLPIGGVDAPIAETMRYMETVIPQVIRESEGNVFTFADMGSDKMGASKGHENSVWNRLDRFLEDRYEGKLTPAQKDRIIRKSVRLGVLTLRVPTLIAANARLPEDHTKYREVPYRSILQLMRPTVFGIDIWDVQDEHERHIIFGSWGKGDTVQGAKNIDSFMPLSDAFSAAWRNEFYLKALGDPIKRDENGKDIGGMGAIGNEFGLWVRFFTQPLRDVRGSEPMTEAGAALYKSRSETYKADILDKILHRDTHILPLARLYAKDSELVNLVGGDFNKFDEDLAPALLAKLTIQMRQKSLNIDMNDPSLTSYEKTMLNLLQANKGKIDSVMNYLQKRKDQILNGAVTVNGKTETLNHLQKKTMSIDDIPLHILHNNEELAAEQGEIGRLLVSEIPLAYQIFQGLYELVIHPEDLSDEKLFKFLDSVQQWKGQEGRSEDFVALAIPALHDLYKARWYDKFVPNWIYEMFPDIPKPNNISEIRDFIPSMNPNEWKIKIDSLVKAGRLGHKQAHLALQYVDGGLRGRFTPMFVQIAIALILVTAIAGATEGMRDMTGAAASAAHH